MTQQIHLPLSFITDYQRENFIVSAANQAALEWVELWPNWGAGAAWLWGPAGCGKTHLLHVWAKRAAAVVLNAPLTNDAMMAMLWRGQHLALDQPLDWLDEDSFFHCLNAAKTGQSQLLITAEQPSARLPLRLADLVSRLNALPQIEILPPDEVLLQMVATKLFADRQLRVEPNVVDYAILRLPRQFAALQRFVALVDEFSLAKRQAVTLSLAKQALSHIMAQEKTAYA